MELVRERPSMSEITHYVLTSLAQNPLIVLCVAAALVMIVVSVIALHSARKSQSNLKFGGDAIRPPAHRSGRAPATHSEQDPVRTPRLPESPPGFDPSSGEIERINQNLRDLRNDNEELRDQILHLKHFNALLPPMVKELNSEVNPDRMGRLVLRAVERLFNPGCALVLLREPGKEKLELVASNGVLVPDGAPRSDLGYGLAGLAAAKKVTITKRDFAHESNLVRSHLSQADPLFDGIEIACPMRSRENCIGVICLGQLRADPEEIRTALNMVGEMSGMALTGARQYQKIQNMANSDPLTGLVNKGYFLKVGVQQFQEAQAKGRPLSVAMFDIDQFKHYNDLNGHLSGDQALIAVAEVLRSKGRPGDTVGRFGGEEFILLMPETTHEEACEVAERIRLAVSESEVEHREKQPLGFLSVSGGVATVPLHGTGMGEVVERADIAMYQAKKSGRNRVISASVAATSMEMVASGKF
jgi:diguanylate cyclase (GGDEF)-like protein